jgi:hypothetical protein
MMVSDGEIDSVSPLAKKISTALGIDLKEAAKLDV